MTGCERARARASLWLIPLNLRWMAAPIDRLRQSGQRQPARGSGGRMAGSDAHQQESPPQEN